MVVNGRFIGRSLVCLLAFGLGLLASDQKCFEQSGDKTILKGDCKGSEVLVVKSQQLKVHFKSSLIESKPEFHLTFGGFEIAGTYLSTHDQAIIQLGGYPYNLPLTMTIMPDNILVKNKKIQRKLDGSSKFEQDGKTYTIKVNYDPLQPQELGSLPITFDATIFVEKEDTTAKIILAAIASLVILVVIIILLVVICFCVLLLLSNQPQTFQRANNKKLKMSKQPPQSTPAAVLISSEPKLPHAYDSPVQPIVNPVKKKEEPVVKDKKLDEEKEVSSKMNVPD
ncbi:hypothetical protein M3Y94_01025600 [Aphelenchoides besseyi]|nr:hypothetical protein M3Y94_01025600 [Aphelenchoides besseyi]KAI6223856.1 hypothetical protein M3Y95_00820800 [Aphelenchoides besseyi]